MSRNRQLKETTNDLTSWFGMDKIMARCMHMASTFAIGELIKPCARYGPKET